MLQTGDLSTKELVKIFGTMKLNKKYEEKKCMSGADKLNLLNKAKKYCDIEDLGGGKFIIHKVYGLVKDDQILQLKNGMYKYFTPLILSKLLNEQDENYNIILPFLGWARRFDIINDNYNTIKYHQEQASQYLKINEDIMFEYFCRVDDCIKYHLHECLSKLASKTLGLIDYDFVTMVKKQIVESNKKEDGTTEINCSNEDSILSPEEHKFVIDCEQQAKIVADIQSEKEKYYGLKSILYKAELRKLLSQRNILYTYSAFSIFCKNKAGVRDVLENFKCRESSTENDFISDFSNKFIEYIGNKAKIRQDKEIVKSQDPEQKYIQEHRLLETYLNEINKLSEITIKQESENLRNSIKIVDTVESIISEFNISIKKGE